MRDATADQANIDLNTFDQAAKASSHAFMVCSLKELNHTTRDTVVEDSVLIFGNGP